MMIQIQVNSFTELEEFAKYILQRGSEPDTSVPVMPEPAPKTEPVTSLDPVPEPASEPEPTEEKAYTMTEVRAYLANLRKAGKKEEVSKLIADMGYEKFTQVPEERFTELMRRAEEL